MRGLWRSLRARARLLTAVLIGAVSYPFLPSALPATTAGIIAWDVGVLVYLLLSALLFLTESVAAMPAHAEAQEEGEWTIFFITLGAVIVSFVAVTSEFSRLKAMSPEWRLARGGLVAVTLGGSWVMTHVSFA